MELISLTSSDILSYKILNIVFDDLDHALFVGNNGTGKSSIFDILCLVLFGESPRKRYKRVVRDIPTKMKHGDGVVVFKQGVSEYKITRVFGQDESLSLECNGEGDKSRTKSMIQAEINRIIGMDFKTFLNVAYSVQGDVGRFLNSTSTDRIEVISNILNFDDINKMIKEIDKQIGIIESEISETQGRLKLLEEATSGETGAEMNREKKKLNIEVKTLTEEKDILLVYISKCDEKFKLQEEKILLVDKFNTKKENAKKLLVQNNQQIKYLTDKEYDEEGIKNKISLLSEKLEILESTNNRLKVIESEIDKLNSAISKLESKRDTLKTEVLPKLEKIVNMEGESCPTCLGAISSLGVANVIGIIDTTNEEIKKFTSKIQKYRESLEIRKTEKLNLEDEKKELNKTEKEKIKLTGKLEQVTKDELRINELKTINLEIKNEFKVQHKEIKPKIDEIKIKLKKYDKYDLDEVEEKETKSDDLIEIIYKKETEISTLDFEIDRYAKSIKELNRTKRTLESYKEPYEIKSYWKKALPKVKIRLISDVIPFLDSEANKYLGQILPGHCMNFKADPNKKQNKLDIDIEDTINKVTRPIEGWSGGEKDKMSLAVYLALNKLASLRSGREINFIILDEKLIFIDVESRPLVFDMLKTEYVGRKIWMISHLQDISPEFDQIVEVKKIGGLSEIKISRN